MAFEQIETHFVKQYSTNVLFLASQKESRLRGTVINETVTGEEKFWDQYGSIEMEEETTRFADSPINITPRESRRLTPVPFRNGEFVDTFDKVRALNDPTSPIVRLQAEAVGRQFDRSIINAAMGTALTGRKTVTSVPLPVSQNVAIDDHVFDGGAGDVGLTVGKLIAAKNVFGRGDVALDRGLHLVCTQDQISNLLTSTQVTSADFNTVQALVRGDINSFLGFTFHVVTGSLLPKTGTTRKIVAYDSQGVVLGVSQEMESRISERSDKSFNWYAFVRLFIGATRTEESRVVTIDCLEV